MKNLKCVSALIALLAAVSTSGVSAQNSPITPYYSQYLLVNDFFAKPKAVQDAKDIIALQHATWPFSVGLVKSSAKIEVASCDNLLQRVDDGYRGSSYREQETVRAIYHSCEALQAIAMFASYSQSYLKDIKVDKHFASLAPAQFSMSISDETVEKAKTMASWSAMSQFTKVEVTDDELAKFYDNTDGVQKVTLMAKGDYNGDNIEDRLLYVENSVIGASYSSVYAFIITRLVQNGPITIVKQIDLK